MEKYKNAGQGLVLSCRSFESQGFSLTQRDDKNRVQAGQNNFSVTTPAKIQVLLAKY